VFFNLMLLVFVYCRAGPIEAMWSFGVIIVRRGSTDINPKKQDKIEKKEKEETREDRLDLSTAAGVYRECLQRTALH